MLFLSDSLNKREPFFIFFFSDITIVSSPFKFSLKSFKSSKLSQNFEKGIAAAIKRAKDISVEF